MTRDVARRPSFLLLRASSACAAIVLAGSIAPACYPDGGGGSDPPTNTFYFPVGLVVSRGGNALYAVNSDFDLQWNGGTLQSYDLFAIRRDTGRLVQAQLAGGAGVNALGLSLVEPYFPGQCLTGMPSADGGGAFPTIVTNPGGNIPPGEGCAPAVDSASYVQKSRIIGAFATDLQLQTANGLVGTRLFMPVRGDATLTFADVGADDPSRVPTWDAVDAGAAPGTLPLATDPFTLLCGQQADDRCDAAHLVGNNGLAAGDTRHATLPGEPYGMAQSPDGTAIAVTHQIVTQASLLNASDPGASPVGFPTMQFVLDNVVGGGSGITAIPHDPQASIPPCEAPTTAVGVPCVRPAFLETSTVTPELDLLRFYDDDGTHGDGSSSMKRPFLVKEATFTFSTNFGGTASYGIAIDPTLRTACKHIAQSQEETTACAELPARLFFANRTPASLVIGQIGGTSPSGDGTFDPDLLQLNGNLPLPDGPSRVYLAPISNLQGNLELRVFVVNSDSGTISVYDPNQPNNPALVDTINVGPNPSAIGFDPFVLDDVANHAANGLDPRQAAGLGLKKFRFAYVSSFRHSFVQVIDLDEQQSTFEQVVFTLGKPTVPKGSGT
jgi:hypothetical protein